MGDLNEQQTLAEITKLNEQTLKLVHEARHHEKRNKWFEFPMVLAVFVAGAVIAKLFL